jgi:uncharacterized RDD family membrane protein YckC
MSATKPPQPPDDGLPKGDSLWRILHDPSQTEEEPAPQAAPASSEPAAPAAPEPGAPAAVDGSRIQRMISAPELLEPEFDYRELTAPPVRDDFDNALRHFYRETGISIKCRNHPQEEASGQCPECQAYYCLNCLVVRRGRLMCRDCAQTVFVPSEEQVISAQVAGSEADSAEIAPEEHPEFQYGGAMFWLEGHPSHPGKQLLALFLDMLLTRGGVMLALFVYSIFNSTSTWPVLAMFHAETKHLLALQMFNAAVLLRPVLPWLVIFAVVDYLYFFLSLSFTNRTFGMSWMGCRIVTEWGDFVSFGAVMLRTLVFMVCLGWPAILIGWFFPAYRGPHDYAGGTLVINYAGVKRVDVYETTQIKL